MYRLALLAFLPLAVSPALAEWSAAEMLSSCKYMTEDRVKGDGVLLKRDFDTGVCWGSFAALQSVSIIVVPPGKQPAFGICAPANSTHTQYIAIFIEYARRNPQRLHEDFALVAIDALKAAFPCHK